MKIPVAVWILAVALLISPLGNLIFNLHARGIPHIFQPEVWWMAWGWISLLDRLWMLALPMAGVLLFFRRKSSWLLALGVLSFVFVLTLVRFVKSDFYLNWVHWYLALGTSLLGLSILYFLRYPYVERRERFAKIHLRSDLHLPAKILLDNQSLDSSLLNISQTGALLELGSNIQAELGKMLNVSIEGKADLEARLVRVEAGGRWAVAWKKPISSELLSILLKNDTKN